MAQGLTTAPHLRNAADELNWDYFNSGSTVSASDAHVVDEAHQAICTRRGLHQTARTTRPLDYEDDPWLSFLGGSQEVMLVTAAIPSNRRASFALLCDDLPTDELATSLQHWCVYRLSGYDEAEGENIWRMLDDSPDDGEIEGGIVSTAAPGEVLFTVEIDISPGKLEQWQPSAIIGDLTDDDE